MALTRITGTVIKDGAVHTEDLPDSGVTAGSYGTGSAVPVLTVNSKGIVTALSTTAVAGVDDFAWDSVNETLTIDTSDGSSYSVNLSGMASESYVDTAVTNLVNSAPAALDTLDELAAALGDDANFATTVTNSLATKVDKIDITGATVGSASQVPVITFNAQGQITSASSTAVAGVSALSYNGQTGVLTIDTADGGSFTTDINVGYDDEPTFDVVTIKDTGGIRGINRNNAGYNLNLLGGQDLTDGAAITINGGQRGGDGNSMNSSLEFFTGSDYESSQTDVVGDYYFKTQWNGNSKTLMRIDSSTGYVGINTVGAPTGTLDVAGNIVVTGTVDGRDLSADGTKLDGIEVGATADQTKADIDALGIDAETLDGLNSTQFLRSDQADTLTGDLTVAGSAEFEGYLRITATGGSQRLVFGNQDSAGVNNPSIIEAANGVIYFGSGDTWSGNGGNNTRVVTIQDNGTVGIGTGTAATNARLEVIDNFAVTGTQPKIRMKETDTTNNDKEILVSGGSLYIRQLNDDNTNGSNLFVLDSSGSATIVGSVTGASLQTQGLVKTADGILFDNDGDFTGSNYFTINETSGNYMRMGYNFDDDLVITSSGNVGIGTDSPSAKLEVEATDNLTTNTNVIRAINAANTGYTEFGAYGFNTAAVDFVVKAGGYEGIRVDKDNGNVGIGTTSPGSKLTVNTTGSNASFYHDTGWADLLIQGGNGGSATNGYLLVRNYGNNTSGSILDNVGSGPLRIAYDNDTRYTFNNDGALFEKELLIRDGGTGNGLHFFTDSTDAGANGIGFNRDVSSGAIYNSNRYAYQMHIQNNNFEIEAYQGSGASIGSPFQINGKNAGFYGDYITLPTGTSDPTGTTPGQCYYNTNDNQLKIYNGTGWAFQSFSSYNPYALDFFDDGSGISLLRFDNSIGDDGGANTFNSGGSYSTGATNSTGQCIDFGSSNNGSYVGIDGRGPRSAAAGGFSWSFWMYYYGSTFNDHGFFGTNSSSSEGHLFHFHATSSQFYVIQSGGSSINNIPVANPQSWNHFCSTFGEDGKMKVYLNGVLQGEQTCTTNFPSSYSSQTLFVGRDRCCEDTMRYTNGAFDHVRIFSRPLNATEVQALYEEFTL